MYGYYMLLHDSYLSTGRHVANPCPTTRVDDSKSVKKYRNWRLETQKARLQGR
jgi:hypothetical protein